MTDLTGLDGDWWLVVEDQRIDPDTTTLLTFSGGVVTERARSRPTGSYRLVDGRLEVEIASSVEEHGPLRITVDPVLPEAGPGAFSVDTPMMTGVLNQVLDDFHYSAGCALVRDGPELDEEKASAVQDRIDEEGATLN